MRIDGNPEQWRQAGEAMQQARQRAGYSLESVAARLHMPLHVLTALEAGDWSRLGAAVFVRGQVRSYARYLGLDAEPWLAATPVAAPALVSRAAPASQWERLFRQLGMKTVYAVMTLGLAIPVYIALTRPVVPETSGAVTVQAPAAREAVNASLAGLPVTRGAAAPQAAPAALVLEFSGESWVQFYAPDGRTLEKGLVAAGQTRQFKPGELGRAVVGNAASVRILHAGQVVDMAPWQRSNVARFEVSSDGKLVQQAQ